MSQYYRSICTELPDQANDPAMFEGFHLMVARIFEAVCVSVARIRRHFKQSEQAKVLHEAVQMDYALLNLSLLFIAAAGHFPSFRAPVSHFFELERLAGSDFHHGA